MASLRRISMLLALTLPIGLAPACDPSTSTKGQLIECTVSATGGVTNCQPTSDTSTSDPSKCIDVDEDGDDDAHDVDDADDADDADGAAVTGPVVSRGSTDDDDGDGTPDEADDDDDNDGVSDTQDCDERQGGDDYDGLR